jgi:phosphatidylglycerophosphatase A
MIKLYSALLTIAIFVTWGYYLLEQTLKDGKFEDHVLISIIPVAIALWFSLWVLRA